MLIIFTFLALTSSAFAQQRSLIDFSKAQQEPDGKLCVMQEVCIDPNAIPAELLPDKIPILPGGCEQETAVRITEERKGCNGKHKESAERMMSLPIFPEMTEEQQNYVVEQFLKVAKN